MFPDFTFSALRTIMRCKKSNAALFVIAIATTLTGCIYSPETEYFKNIPKPDVTPTTISLFSTGDTVDIRGYVSINLQTANQAEVAHYKLTVGDNVIVDQDGAPYQISFDSKKYGDGTYDLTLTLTKKVTSGSMASKAGLEFSTVELKKKVIIFNAPITPPDVSATIENGMLVLNWKPYLGRVFKNYVISGSIIDDFHPITISDRHQTSLILENFVGGYANFNISYQAYNEYAVTRKNFDFTLPVNVERTNTGVNITIGESPFVNYGGANLQFDNKGTQSFVDLDPSQHSYFYPVSLVFPYDLVVYSNVKSKNNVWNENGQRYLTTRFLYLTFDNVISMAKTLNDTVFNFVAPQMGYSNDTKEIIHINSNSGHSTQRTGNIGTSPNGQYIFELKNKTSLVKIDQNTLQDVESFDVSSIVGTFQELIAINVSDLSMVAVYVERSSNKYAYFILDWNAKQVLYSAETSQSQLFSSTSQLSPDGKKSYHTNSIISFDRNPPSTGDVPNNPNDIEIGIPQKGHEIIWMDYMGTKTLYERDIIAKSIISVDYPKQVKSIFNSDSNYVGVVYNENDSMKIDFVELGTLKVVNTLKTSWSGNVTSTAGRFFIIDRTFYLYEGSGEWDKFDF